MLCGLGVPSLRSLWGAVWNRRLYILRMYCKGCISFNFSIFFYNLHHLPQKKIHFARLPQKNNTRLDNFLYTTYIFTYTRWCKHKAVCSHRRSLVISGGCGGWPPRRAERAICRVKRAKVHNLWAMVGGVHTRRCLHRVVHTQGGLWPLKRLVIEGGCTGWPPRRVKRAELFFAGTGGLGGVTGGGVCGEGVGGGV